MYSPFVVEKPTTASASPESKALTNASAAYFTAAVLSESGPLRSASPGGDSSGARMDERRFDADHHPWIDRRHRPFFGQRGQRG
jgi:hypothetical protein